MRNYESIIIFSPSAEENLIDRELEEIDGLIKEHGGEVLSKDKWGKRKLTYPIKKNDIGYYVLINFSSEPKGIEALDLKYKFDQNILRYNIIKREEHGRI